MDFFVRPYPVQSLWLVNYVVSSLILLYYIYPSKLIAAEGFLNTKKVIKCSKSNWEEKNIK